MNPLVKAKTLYFQAFKPEKMQFKNCSKKHK